MGMDALFLGIDAGTTKIKTVLFDQKGNELKFARRQMAPVYNDFGNVLADMNEVWNMVVETIREVTQDSKQFGEIKAIGITAQGDGLWMLDKDKKPFHPAVLWLDGRATSYINRWNREGILNASGRVVFAGSTLPYSVWHYDNEPDTMKKAKHVLFCKDWIKYCLTGKIVTDPTDLSDASLIRASEGEYNGELLGKFHAEQLLELLPPIAGSTDVVGYVSEAAAEATGLEARIPVVNGAIDVVCTAVGSGVYERDTAVSIVGTTVYSEMATDSLDLMEDAGDTPPSVICHAAKDRWLLAYGTMMGAPNVDWFMREMFHGELSFEDAERRIKKIAAGADGIIFLPFLAEGGERAPFVKSTASAQFYGMKAHHSIDHMLRAVYEGVALSMKDCYEHFPEKPTSIRLSGGGSASDIWCQIFADCAKRPVETIYGNEVGARGAAIAAGVGVGFFSDVSEGIREMVKVKRTFEPNEEACEKYDRIYAVYTELCRRLWDVWDMEY